MVAYTEGVATKPPPYAFPKSVAEKIGIMVEEAFERGPGPSGRLVGDGTMLYPDMTSGPVIDVAEIFEETKLRIVSPVLGDAVAPKNKIPGWLVVDFVGAVVRGAFGKVNEYRVSGAPLDLLFVDTEA